ncbi:MAG TPA: Rnase Y domain-containing protein, partial [Candidatus Absconditabacterales bacterium]|nr:Rnase Y domain-containing protein [Candidatus Absconditabacterales bacterium]
MSFLTVLTYLALLGVGGTSGYLVYQRVRREQLSAYKKKIGKAEHIAEEILEKAEKNLKESEEKAKGIIENAQKDIDKRYEKIDQVEERLIQKEEKIDQKYDSLEKEKENIAKKSQELDALSQEQREKLSQIAKLSYEDAKQELLSIVEQEQKKDILAFVEKFKTIKQEEAEKESVHLLTKILPRIAMNSVSEYTVSSVDIPSEDVKGKLIGREGRN